MWLPVQAIADQLKEKFACVPVFIEQDLKDKYYKGALKWWPGLERGLLHGL